MSVASCAILSDMQERCQSNEAGRIYRISVPVGASDVKRDGGWRGRCGQGSDEMAASCFFQGCFKIQRVFLRGVAVGSLDTIGVTPLVLRYTTGVGYWDSLVSVGWVRRQPPKSLTPLIRGAGDFKRECLCVQSL